MSLLEFSDDPLKTFKQKFSDTLYKFGDLLPDDYGLPFKAGVAVINAVEKYKETHPEDEKVSWSSYIIPRYGKFAGPEYSYGIRSKNTDVDRLINTEAIDALDHATKRHDALYSLALTASDYRVADKILLDDIKRLTGLQGDASVYKALMKKAFEAKFGYNLYSDPDSKYTIQDSAQRMKLYDWLAQDKKYGYEPIYIAREGIKLPKKMETGYVIKKSKYSKPIVQNKVYNKTAYINNNRSFPSGRFNDELDEIDF